MQAEGLRKGDRLDQYDQFGKVCGGWTATGNAVVEGDLVYVAVRHHDGQETTNVWHKGEQVPITFGVGTPPEKTGIEQIKELLTFDE